MFWFGVGTAIAGVVLNYNGTGRFTAIAQDWTEEQYAAYLKPSVDRAIGNRDPLMACTKEEDGTFTFTPVTMHTEGVAYPRKFTVQVKSKRPGMRLAELEFGDWKNNPDLSITITEIEIPDTLDRPTPQGTEAYDRVLTTLKGLPLFLNTETHSPKQKIDEISGHVDFPFGLQKWVGGEWTGHYFVDPEKGQLPSHYEKEAFFDEVLFSAVEGENDTIIDGYFEEIDSGLESELRIVETKKEEAKKRIDDAAKEDRDSRRKLMITTGVLILTVGLIALGIALMLIPGAQAIPLIGAAITGLTFVGQVVMNIIGAASKWEGLFGTLAVAGVVIGIRRTISTHKKYLGELSEAKLKELNELSSGFTELRKVLKTQKSGLTNILKSIYSVRKSKADTLDLSGQVVRDNGVKMVSMAFLTAPTKHGEASLATTCTTLNLSNSSITGNSVRSLERILRSPTRLTIIDVSKNAIGEGGMGQLHDALMKNFTVTTLHYDVKGVPQDLQDKITFQLNINRYLHNEPLIGEGVDEERVREKALIKLKQNAVVTEIAGTIREDLQGEVNAVLTQNRFFVRMRVRDSVITPEVFLEAYRADPGRMESFAVANRGYWEAIRSKVFPGTSGKRRNLLELQRLEPVTRKRLLKQLISFGREDREIDQKVTLLSDLIEIKTCLPSDEKMGKGQAAEFKLLILEITGMLDTLGARTLEQSKEELEKKRLALSAIALVDEEMLQSKREVLDILETALNPDLVENAVMRRQKKALHIVNVRPNTVENLAYFVSIYSKDKANDLPGYFSEEMSRDKLLKMVRMDMVGLDQQDGGGCTQLQLLDEPHRTALLEYCFGGEENVRKKAVFISSLIAMDQLFNSELSQNVDVQLLRRSLKSAFNKKGHLYGGPESYSNLKSAFLNLRKQLKQRKSAFTLEEVDQPLQTVLQDGLKKTYPFLAGGDAVVDEGLYGAFREELRDHFELREYTFPEGLNPKVKEELSYIIARNRWYDTLMDRSLTEGKTIDLFFEMGTRMPVGQFQQALREMNQHDKIALLIRDEIAEDSQCEKLKGIDEQRRVLLLKHCFEPSEDAFEKALFTSAMIAEDGFFVDVERDPFDDFPGGEPETVEERARYILSWSLKQSVGSAYTYNAMRVELNKCREDLKTSEGAGSAGVMMLDRPHQVVLTESLKRKYACLRGERLDDVRLDGELTRLGKELVENFDLREYVGSLGAVPVGAKKMIEMAVKRNQLRDLTIGYPVSQQTAQAFIDSYRSVGTVEECEASLSEMRRSEQIQALLKLDLYDDSTSLAKCEKLRSLSAGQRMVLLEHSYGEEVHAKSRATLASGMIGSEKLFELAKSNRTDPLVKDLLGKRGYLVYTFSWSYSRAYTYEQLKENLEAVKVELTKGAAGKYSNTPVEVREEVLSSLTRALEQAETAELRSRSEASSKPSLIGLFNKPKVSETSLVDREREEERTHTVDSGRG